MNAFQAKLVAHGLSLRRSRLHTLQLNIGRQCNQACRHCHVDAAPWRTETIQEQTAHRIGEWIQRHQPSVVDLTGGAPELSQFFRYFVETARAAGAHVIDRNNLTIIEDDIFRLLDQRLQPPTFYSLAPERTYHITSLSKTLAPGLRIGFVATPPGRAQFLRLRQRAAGARVTGLTAEVARYWLETDVADHIMRRVVGEMAARRNIFREVFSKHTFICEPGAPYGWLSLPSHWSPLCFASAALSHNIKITPGSAFSFGPQALDHGVRICFGPPATAHDLRGALVKIRDLMGEDPEDDFTPVA